MAKKKAAKEKTETTETKIKRPRRPFMDRVISAVEVAQKLLGRIDAVRAGEEKLSDGIDQALVELKALAAAGFEMPKTGGKKTGFADGDAVSLTDKGAAKHPDMTEAEKDSLIVEFFDSSSKQYALKSAGRFFCVKPRHIQSRAVADENVF